MKKVNNWAARLTLVIMTEWMICWFVWSIFGKVVRQQI